jgi:hypothetical protein
LNFSSPLTRPEPLLNFSFPLTATPEIFGAFQPKSPPPVSEERLLLLR